MLEKKTIELLRDEYMIVMHDLASNFQFLEEGIKLYLDHAFRIIKKNTEDVIPFDYSRDDFEDNSLGKLLNVFKKLNSNTKLISEISQLVKERNKWVHTGYLLIFHPQITADEKKIEQLIKSSKGVATKSKECLLQMSEELNKICGEMKQIGTTANE